MDALEPSWRERLLPEYNKSYFQKLMVFLSQEISSGKVVYPPSDDVFTALNICPFDKIKVFYFERWQYDFRIPAVIGGDNWARPLPRPRSGSWSSFLCEKEC